MADCFFFKEICGHPGPGCGAQHRGPIELPLSQPAHRLFMFKLMTGTQGKDGTRCVKYLIPRNFSADDMYAMKDFARLKMPPPNAAEESEDFIQKVPVISWEFVTLISVMIGMSTHYSWRPSLESRRRSMSLGMMDDAEGWYADKLLWYSSWLTREACLETIQKRMTKFFEECPTAWQELEAIKGMGTVARARKTPRVSGRPTGAPMEPSDAAAISD